MTSLKTSLVLLILILGCNLHILAQEAKEPPKMGWINSIIGSLNLTQTSFDNWQQGGENSVSWQLNLNGKFENNQERTNWTNTGKISYGKIKVSDAESRKSIDEIKLESVLTYLLNLYVNPYMAATAETQFTKGYKYTEAGKFVVSNFLDPGYFTQSMGIGFTPIKFVKTRLGAALKETVSDRYGYANNPNTETLETFKTEIGSESVTDLESKLAENILLTSKLELFSNLKASNEIDVRWDTILAAKVSNFVDVNFNIKLFYDRDISTKRQLKQALAMGLTYTFL
jgi:hypothetical protein